MEWDARRPGWRSSLSGDKESVPKIVLSTPPVNISADRLPPGDGHRVVRARQKSESVYTFLKKAPVGACGAVRWDKLRHGFQSQFWRIRKRAADRSSPATVKTTFGDHAAAIKSIRSVRKAKSVTPLGIRPGTTYLISGKRWSPLTF
jgi:hypothetical protein